ncbi:hypothetical protein GCM10020000_08030 [Streptomyces olivoverticillatus]
MVDGPAPFGDHLAGFVFPLPAALGQGPQRLVVVEAAQQRQFPELRGDDPDRGPFLDERDPAVADLVGQAPVDAVRAALHLHPGQHAQQPPRADALHLRDALGGGRQVPRSGDTQAELRQACLLFGLLRLLPVRCGRHPGPFPSGRMRQERAP